MVQDWHQVLRVVVLVLRRASSCRLQGYKSLFASFLQEYYDGFERDVRFTDTLPTRASGLTLLVYSAYNADLSTILVASYVCTLRFYRFLKRSA